MLNSALVGVSEIYAPQTPATLTTASADTVAQGQFGSFDASTPIVTTPSAGVIRIRVKLKSLPIANEGEFAGGGEDVGTILQLHVFGGGGGVTVNSIAIIDSLGTLQFQLTGGDGGVFDIQPVPSGVDRAKVDCLVTLSAGSNTSRVVLRSRSFVAAALIDTLP